MKEAQDITRLLGGEWSGSYGLSPCPCCQREKRKDQRALSASVHLGRLMLNCHKSGCDFKDIIAASQYKGVRVTTSPQDNIRMQQKIERLRDAAYQSAKRIIQSAKLAPHAYTNNKGFPRVPVPVVALQDAARHMHVPKLFNGLSDHSALLCVPIKDPDGKPTSVQLITETGLKYFLYRGKITGSGCYLKPSAVDGKTPTVIMCEGFATGMAIRSVANRIKEPVKVVCSLSAVNMLNLAPIVKPDAIIADNDPSQTGEKYARQCHVPVAIPPIVGQDFCDLNKSDPKGAEAVLAAVLAAAWSRVDRQTG